jgi:hypothetical protein
VIQRRNISEALLNGVKLPPAGSDVTQFICVPVERKAADPEEKNQSIFSSQPKFFFRIIVRQRWIVLFLITGITV